MAAPVRVTVLGSGTSQGVPMIGCPCAVCRSPDPRDRRTRSSLYVDDGVLPFLIDTTPELRLQCLAAGVSRVEAVLFTHNHADHVFGYDDLRRFCEANGRPLDIYGSPETVALLRQTFSYAFDTSIQVPHYVRTTPHVFPPDAPLRLGTLTVWPLRVVHGRAETHGFLIEREGRKLLAYIPDAKEIPEAARARLQGVELAITWTACGTTSTPPT
ncbi:MAG: MBL fold metallo-hydrolase [Verrucomicrobium sp.]|nr:MBL fold metallo-hydrolase [Verrucomicrobium sp.]